VKAELVGADVMSEMGQFDLYSVTVIAPSDTGLLVAAGSVDLHYTPILMILDLWILESYLSGNVSLLLLCYS